MADERVGPQSPMTAIGVRLKEAREKRALSIEQVQRETHIHATVLTALEAGRCDEILTETYVKAFLKKYAQHLGVDQKEVLKDYAALHPKREEVEKAAAAHDSHLAGTDIVSRSISIASFAILLLAFLFLLAFLWKKITPVFTVVRRPAVTTPAPVKAKAAKASKTAESRKSSKAKAAPSAEQPKTRSKSAITKKTAPPAAPATVVATPAPKPAPPAQAPFKFTLKVNRPAMVELKRDGTLLFKQLLPKGTMETYTADERINLYVANAEDVEVFLNGQYLGSPGRGIIKNLEITRQGMKIR